MNIFMASLIAFVVECDATRGYHVINFIAHVIALILT